MEADNKNRGTEEPFSSSIPFTQTYYAIRSVTPPVLWWRREHFPCHRMPCNGIKVSTLSTRKALLKSKAALASDPSPTPSSAAKFISAFSPSLAASLSAPVQIKVQFPLCGVPAQGSLMELKLFSGFTHGSHYLSYWCACMQHIPLLLTFKTAQDETEAALSMHTVFFIHFQPGGKKEKRNIVSQ